MTYGEILDKVIKEDYRGEDNTCNGKCSKCGECCGNVLPIDQEDADKIQDYVVKHKIFPQRHLLIMKQKWQCPYYTGNKEKGCAIYVARPKICKIYQCNKRPSVEEMKILINTMPIDMWAFADAIEEEMKKVGINKETRKATN